MSWDGVGYAIKIDGRADGDLFMAISHFHIQIMCLTLLIFINILYGKQGRIITRSLEKVTMMLKVNITNSSTTKACLVTDSSSRKTRVKQCNNIKGFSRNQLLLGGM
jgi:hypothetical protein